MKTFCYVINTLLPLEVATAKCTPVFILPCSKSPGFPSYAKAKPWSKKVTFHAPATTCAQVLASDVEAQLLAGTSSVALKTQHSLALPSAWFAVVMTRLLQPSWTMR